MERGLFYLEDAALPTFVYVPARGWEPGGRAMLHLHGRGESGTDGQRQLIHGPVQAAIRDVDRWPFLMVMPQKPTFEAWWRDQEAAVNAVLEMVEARWATDPHRRVIAGLSQGGCGTFELTGRLRWQFAGAVPVCGFTQMTDLGERFREVPTWAWHGADDSVVPVSQSEGAVAQIRAGGGEAQLTVLPGVGHNAWEPAWASDELAQWLKARSLD